MDAGIRMRAARAPRDGARSCPEPLAPLITRRSLHRVSLILGFAISAAVAINLAVATPFLPLWRQRTVRTIIAHTGVMLLVWGLLPEVQRELRRVAASLAGPRRRRVIAYIVGPAAVITGISVTAPRYAHELLTREWGLLEPLQFAVYVLIAVMCLDIARLTAPGDAAGPLYRAATWVAVALAAEELDYLGIVSLVAEAFGATGGRVGGQYIGALHDVANVAARHVGALTVCGVIVALAALAWLVAGRYRAAIRRELASPSSMPLVLAAVLMTIAQLTDIDDRALVDARAAGGLRLVNLLEEPMELVAQLCLLACLTVKYAERSRRRSVTHATMVAGC